MPRLLFEKRGNAVWISHLDLMRLFQRAFKRAGLPLTHTKGFNPRPSVSIALPLSVGIESRCELLDFDLEKAAPWDEIQEKLNAALVSGIRVKQVYEDGRKIKNLAFLDCCLTFEYDDGVPENGAAALEQLFRQEEILVEKKSKNGVQEQNIGPMIRKLTVEEGDSCLEIKARICCQNPSLNPMQLHGAVLRYLPELAPGFVRCGRAELFDTEENIFR